MALITLDEIDNVTKRAFGKQLGVKSASTILQEDTKRHRFDDKFDIFLSHSYADVSINRERLLGVKGILEEFGYSVYVDWIIDKELDRENITAKTARTLRIRMTNSKCLLFVTSQNSIKSRWMPWELGYKDGLTGKYGGLGMVAILPLASRSGQQQYRGQEYLGMYPYIVKANSKSGHSRLWVYHDPETYVVFDDWLAGKKPFKREK